MEKTFSKKIGKAVIGFFVIMVTTSVFAYGSCSTHTTCVGNVCADVRICTTTRS